MDRYLTPEQCMTADGLVVITFDPNHGGFAVHAEGSERLSREKLARILARYAAYVLEDIGSRN